MSKQNKNIATLWIYVTADEYELPIYVADDPSELASVLKCTKNNIYQMIKDGNRIKKVVVDDENGEIRAMQEESRRLKNGDT